MKKLFLILFLLTEISALAQSRADRLFEKGEYMDALKAYTKDLEGVKDRNDKKNDRLKARVANCYFRLNDMVRASQMYNSLDQKTLGAEDLLFFAHILQRSGDYDKALALADRVEALNGSREGVEILRASCDFAKRIEKEAPLYTAEKTNVEFAGFSSGVTYYKGGGIILAAPGTGTNAMKDSRGYKVTRLYQATFTDAGRNVQLMPFGDELAATYHVGAVAFTKKINRIYYTKTALKKDGTSILKLMTAEDVGGKWGRITELSINSDAYSCAHPCLYRDSLLYFVSNMPGGYGGKDIYVMPIQGAKCGKVRNLGNTINTSQDELFPFVSENGKLYFASSGHVGLGGLDVFVSEPGEKNQWSRPQNMGKPINSSMDDFALVFKDADCQYGFVSTNRVGSGYEDFLFSLKRLSEQKPVKEEPPVKTVVTKTVEVAADVPAPVVFSEERKPVAEVKREKIADDYSYSIQVGAYRNPVPRTYFERFKEVKVYLGQDNLYRYTVGEFPDKSVAQLELVQTKRVVRDAFVVNVGQYVTDKKMRSGVKGDAVSDEELLLIRLKNYDKMKQERALTNPNVKKYMAPARESEIHLKKDIYVIVLMSADKVLDLADFVDIDEVDVYAMTGGKYMYCTGKYTSEQDAQIRLKTFKLKFKEAYIVKISTYGH